jgi:hypothetical protein
MCKADTRATAAKARFVRSLLVDAVRSEGPLIQNLRWR